MAELSEIRETVRERYAAAASGCCSPEMLSTCCAPEHKDDCCGAPMHGDAVATAQGAAPASCGCQPA